MKVQRRILRQFLAYRRYSYAQLSEACKPAKVSKSIIGHLASGERKSCKPETARAIEEALGAPPGAIFVPEVLAVTHNTYRPAA